MQLEEVVPRLETLEGRLQPLQARLASHPHYRSTTRMEDLRAFMEAHLLAV